MISPKQRASSQAILFWASEGRAALPGAIPYNGLDWKALPRRGIFFRIQLCEKVGISLAEVYERVGESVISV